MSKHTPGPWSVQTSPTNQLFIRCEFRAMGKNARHELSDLIATITMNAVADVRSENARLIAAAPDLLEACRMAQILLRGSGFTESTPTLAALRRAIEKAEGGE